MIVRVLRSMATVSPYGRLPPLRSEHLSTLKHAAVAFGVCGSTQHFVPLAQSGLHVEDDDHGSMGAPVCWIDAQYVAPSAETVPTWS